MNQEIVDQLNKVNYLPELFEREIYSIGVMTGSKVFLGKHVASDTDYIVDTLEFKYYNAPEFINASVVASEYSINSTTHSIYTKTAKGDILNIIFCKNEEIKDIWVSATKAMLAAIKADDYLQYVIQDKTKRVELFTAFRRVLGDDTNK